MPLSEVLKAPKAADGSVVRGAAPCIGADRSIAVVGNEARGAWWWSGTEGRRSERLLATAWGLSRCVSGVCQNGVLISFLPLFMRRTTRLPRLLPTISSSLTLSLLAAAFSRCCAAYDSTARCVRLVGFWRMDGRRRLGVSPSAES